MIRVTCPHCSQNIEAADEWAGREVDCPGCAVKFIIPPLAQVAPVTGKAKKILIPSIATVAITVIACAIYFANRNPTPTPPPESTAQVIESAPPILVPAIIDLQEPPAPPEPKTAAQMIRDGLPSGDPLTLSHELDKILSDLALKEDLRVNDFDSLAAFVRNEKSPFVSTYFLAVFGKPDSEYTHTAEWKPIEFLPAELIRVVEYTYLNRVFNATTEKKEDLTVVFYDGRFAMAKTPSGHKSH